MITSLILLIIVLIMIIFGVLAERKVKGSMQRRIGPNSVGWLGLLQTLADGIKLIIKETIIPIKSLNFVFIISPLLFFLICLLNWSILPLDLGISIISLNQLDLLFTITLSELSIIGTLYSGFSSRSKYSFLGSVRAIGLMISYSIGKSLSLIILYLLIGSLDYLIIYYSQYNIGLIYIGLPVIILLIICTIAELARCPFDLIEAESELVAGQKTEYSGVIFSFFFLGEYSKKLLKGCLISLLSFGITNPLKFYFIILWLRASFPRIRFDSKLSLGWKIIIPLLTGLLILYSSIILLLV